MNVERCETCRFWKPTYEEDGIFFYGDCLRYPPTLTDKIAAPGAKAAWPDTARGEWCGEWQANRVALPVVDGGAQT